MRSLTIIIPSYRRVDLLESCLRSVVLHAPSWAEVLVVDDASTDASVSKLAETFPGVKALRMPRRSGFCKAVNAGLRAATGEIVELLNDDTEVCPGWVEAALKHFENPRIAAVAPLVLQHSSPESLPLIDSAGDAYDVGGFAFKRGHGLPASQGEFQQSQEVWGVSGAAGFFRRDTVLQAGGLPDDFGAYFEDVDLSHRLRHHGYQAWYEPNSKVWHHVSSSYGQRPSRRTLEQQSCNEERLFWRNTPTELLWKHLPRHAAVLCGKALRRIGEGTFAPWLTGRLRAVQSQLRARSRPVGLRRSNPS
jgi:GT2 family glycosyltransferase